MQNLLGVLSLVGREMVSTRQLERRPEPHLVMEETAEDFHLEGAHAGSLVPLYHFNALSMSTLLKKHATVVDLGSGSGQFLIHLSRLRPDLKIIGYDLSEKMIAKGKTELKELKLEDRVQLRNGDMTEFVKSVNGPVDLVSSIFSLHHLPSTELVKKCFSEIQKLQKKTACGVWLFDHVRPKNPKTPVLFPEVFTPTASLRFKQDSQNSLIASFSFEELTGFCNLAKLKNMEHECSKTLRLYQIHWCEPEEMSLMPEPVAPINLSPDAERKYMSFRRLFKKAGRLIR